MKHIALFIAMAVCLLPGCARGLGPDADPEQGRRALQTALEAWKIGKAPGDLGQGQPPIVMNEPDWHLGKRLLDFKMEEKSSMHGRQVRWEVQIKVQDKAGETRDRKAKYIIDTTPRIVIVRDDQS